jgi:N-glycosylase/DNA lyase
MKDILRCVMDAKSDDTTRKVEHRLKEFKRLGKRSSKELFKELCFCVLTANYTAEGSIRIQRAIGDGFLTLPDRQLAAALRKNGHRFPNTRARYICEARKHAAGLKEGIKSIKDKEARREWLVRNIKGLGYKEASHFLRNIGFLDYAIVDFHIVDFLQSFGVIKKPKTLTPRKYILIEQELRKVAKALGMSLAELDLYMWYCETGKVLK